jgi:GNAT superfamily N-acetyltransferase
MIALGTAEDRNYILDSWAKGYSESRDVPPKELYWLLYPQLFRTLLARSNVLTWRAKANDPWIAGYLVYESIDSHLVIHWLNVKTAWRGQGIAKALLNAAQKATETTSVAFTLRRAPWAGVGAAHGFTYVPQYLYGKHTSQKGTV